MKTRAKWDKLKHEKSTQKHLVVQTKETIVNLDGITLKCMLKRG